MKTNLTSSCFQDAGKSLSPTSSPLAPDWQVLRKACAVSMSRSLTAASCKSRRFVSSLILKCKFCISVSLNKMVILQQKTVSILPSICMQIMFKVKKKCCCIESVLFFDLDCSAVLLFFNSSAVQMQCVVCWYEQLS